MRALQYRAKEVDVELPVISQILPSNKLQIQQAFDQIMETGKRRSGLASASRRAPTMPHMRSISVQGRLV
jgi:GDP-mannose 6-dehydrogenase